MKTMTLVRGASLAAAAFAVAVAAAAGSTETERPASLADLLPESTFAFLAVPDLSIAAKAFEGTDLGAGWAELAPFVAEVRHGLEPQILDVKAKFERETGLPPDRVLAALDGCGVEVGVPKNGGSGLVLLRTAGHEAIVRELAVKLSVPAEGEPLAGTETAEIETLKLAKEPQLFYAAELPGGVLWSYSRSDLESALAVAAGKPPKGFAPLSGFAEFAAMKKALLGTSTPLACVYVNPVQAIDEAVRRSEKDAHAIYQTGLRDLRSVGAALTFAHGKVEVSAVARAPASGERHGVLPVLDHGPVDTAALAALAPRDATAIAGLKLDPAAAYDRALALIAAIDPEAGAEVKKKVIAVERDLRVSIREDLLAPLGGDWAASCFIPEGGGIPEGVLSVSVSDPDRLRTALKQLTDDLHMETRELTRGGRTLRYARAALGTPGHGHSFSGGPGDAIALALAGSATSFQDGRVYVSGLPQGLEDYFARTPAKRESAGALPLIPQGNFVLWHDPRPTLPFLVNGLTRFAKLVEGPARLEGLPLDAALIPRGAVLARNATPGDASLAIDADGVTLRVHLDMEMALGVATSVAAALAK